MDGLVDDAGSMNPACKQVAGSSRQAPADAPCRPRRTSQISQRGGRPLARCSRRTQPSDVDVGQ
eukprot:6182614-Pleurochrysis_carterae.AAC.3